MELSVFIARIASVIYLAAALGGFVSMNYYRRVSEDLYENAALTFLMGFTAIILGGLIVHHHNRWVGDWTVLITAMGWIAVVKGFVLIAFPEWIRVLSAPLTGPRGLKVFPFVTLLVGLLLGYFGFVRGG